MALKTTEDLIRDLEKEISGTENCATHHSACSCLNARIVSAFREKAAMIRAHGWFQERMLDKLLLRRNLEKRFWRDTSIRFLLDALKEEVRELELAYFNETDTAGIVSECCDVANFAMMIADLARKKKDR